LKSSNFKQFILFHFVFHFIVLEIVDKNSGRLLKGFSIIAIYFAQIAIFNFSPFVADIAEVFFKVFGKYGHIGKVPCS
jgi:hypothetical protein